MHDSFSFGEYEQSGREATPISARGIALGGAIGLASGLALDFLAPLLGRVLSLPWLPASLDNPLGSWWLALVLLATTAAGAVYYARDE